MQSRGKKVRERGSAPWMHLNIYLTHLLYCFGIKGNNDWDKGNN